MIASASNDNTVKLWNLAGELLQNFSGHDEPVISVAFAPDGKTIASASNDKTVKLWNLDLDSLVAKSCEWLRDYLTHNPKVSASDKKILEEIH
jgi:WD40 repeat protein